MNDVTFRLHGPAEPRVPLVLDSPHSGFEFPADFDAVVSEFDLRDGEDCFVDELYMPATELGVPLLAALTPRTYLDPNRHAGDIDLDLIEGGKWPHTHVPSGKARIGKALIWRTLDDGRAIYGRKLKVDEVLARIERHHTPYHRALRDAIDRTHARFGVVYHINCHSMNSVAGKMGEGGAGFASSGFRSRRSRWYDVRSGIHRVRARHPGGDGPYGQRQRPVQRRRAGQGLFEACRPTP